MLKLDIQCNPSKIFILCLILLAFASMVLVFCLSIKWPYRYSLIFIILFYVIDNIYNYGLLSGRNAIVRLQLLKEDDWQLTTQQGIFLAKLHSVSMINSFMMVLLFKLEKKRLLRTSVIVRDSINKENYRDLLVYLRMKT